MCYDFHRLQNVDIKHLHFFFIFLFLQETGTAHSSGCPKSGNLSLNASVIQPSGTLKNAETVNIEDSDSEQISIMDEAKVYAKIFNTFPKCPN